MSSIAQRALNRAREIPAAALVAPAASFPPAPELVITGPINRVMELEGRSYAVDVLRSLGSSIRNPLVVASTIRNLTMTATGQPSSHASGIKQVIDLLKEAT